jgi:hypothetical protein
MNYWTAFASQIWMGRRMRDSRVSKSDELLKGRHFDREVVVLCVRWYLRFKLSYRDPVEMMAGHGLSMVHTTIMRWVRRYAPEFERRWNQFARPAGASWRIDEVHGAAPDIQMQHRFFERNPA